MPEIIETNTSARSVPQNSFPHKGAKTMKYVAIVLLLAALALVVVVVVRKNQLGKNGGKVQPPLHNVFLTSGVALAEGLPSDIVTAVDPNAVIIRSYKTSGDNGLTQSTVQFRSTLTYQQLINLYKQYFKKNEWAQLTIDDQGAVASLSFVRKLDQINMVVTNRQEVDISIIRNPGNNNSTSK